MLSLSMKEMLEVGAHFGHQTHRWNPKMRPYLYGERNGVHIINLQKTVGLFKRALEFVIETVASGGDLLFVGTKKQARETVATQASRAGMHYVNDRWMGGTLTNFQTIKSSIDRLIEMEEKREKDEYAGLTKKERINIDRKIIKLSAALGGIRTLKGAPAALVIVDPRCERIAVHEAKTLNVPIVAMTDTNCDPSNIDYAIPANDDANRSIQYFVEKLADACLIGLELREARTRTRVEDAKARAEEAGRGRQVRGSKGTAPKAYVKKSLTAEDANIPAEQTSYSASAQAEVEEPAAPDNVGTPASTPSETVN